MAAAAVIACPMSVMFLIVLLRILCSGSLPKPAKTCCYLRDLLFSPDSVPSWMEGWIISSDSRTLLPNISRHVRRSRRGRRSIAELHVMPKQCLLLILLLCSDVELNPGPSDLSECTRCESRPPEVPLSNDAGNTIPMLTQPGLADHDNSTQTIFHPGNVTYAHLNV